VDMLVASFLFSLMTFDPMTMMLVGVMTSLVLIAEVVMPMAALAVTVLTFGGGRCCSGLLRHKIELFLHHIHHFLPFFLVYKPCELVFS